MTEPKRPPSTTLHWLGKRLWIQFAFLFVWLDPLLLRLHNFCGGVYHCYACPLATFACPIGVIANFSALHVFPFIAFGTLAFIGGLVGAFICGWVCPFGFLQDLFAKIPTPRFSLPRWAGYFRYVVLVGLVLVIPFVWGESHPLFICRVCPAGGVEAALPRMINSAITGKPLIDPGDSGQTTAAQNQSPPLSASPPAATGSSSITATVPAQNTSAHNSFADIVSSQNASTPNATASNTTVANANTVSEPPSSTTAANAAAPSALDVAAEKEPIRRSSVTKIVIIISFFVVIFFMHRPWCVLFCPLGAIYGLTNKISAMHLDFNSHKCIKCGWCRKLCKYGVEPDRAANDLRCVRCLECTRCGVLTVSNVLKKGD